MKEINDNNFNEIIKGSDKPVLVDFWAPWCAPCRGLLPVIESIASEMGDAIDIVKFNVDDNPLTPREFGIKSIPTLMIFKAGVLADQKSGAMSKADLIDWINSTIK